MTTGAINSQLQSHLAQQNGAPPTAGGAHTVIAGDVLAAAAAAGTALKNAANLAGEGGQADLKKMTGGFKMPINLARPSKQPTQPKLAADFSGMTGDGSTSPASSSPSASSSPPISSPQSLPRVGGGAPALDF